ncbi:DUF1798 family protein [Bacillus sp. N9]
MQETGVEGDFYQEVKPFADAVKECTMKWEPEAVKWILQNKPKQIYPMQIKTQQKTYKWFQFEPFFLQQA